ncbi:MAG: hypothetical protein GY847_07740 [Proteobacteria bacterium]|nr:hypothetical protein [Pseudomonadota bacterium]
MNTNAQSLASVYDADSPDTRAPSISERWFKEDPTGGGTRREVFLDKLRSLCRKGSRNRPGEMDLRGINLANEDLSGLDLSRYDLSEADLTGANLNNSNFSWAKLVKTNLYKADLEGCEFLGADLTSATLNECQAQRVGFGASNLSGASLVGSDLQEATMTEAKLCGADFRAANLRGASIRNADLSNASFTRASIQDADLKHSDVSGTDFRVANLADTRLLGLKNFTKALWVGADIRGVDLRGAYMIRRHIMDENYLFEFKSSSRYHHILYWIWWATSDCGRSIGRWGAFIMGVAAIFAGFYSIVDVDFGPHKTSFSPFYYSIVTLTTLGYGDAVPASLAAQVVAAIEALLGYIGLGGLLSILSNKIARRAD